MRPNRPGHFVLFFTVMFSTVLLSGFVQLACSDQGYISVSNEIEQSNCKSLCVSDVLWTVDVKGGKYLLKARKADSDISLAMWQLTSPELIFNQQEHSGQIIADSGQWQADAKKIILVGNIKASFIKAGFDGLELYTNKLIIDLNQQSWNAPNKVRFVSDTAEVKSSSASGRLDQKQQIKLFGVEVVLGTGNRGDIAK